MAAINHEGRPDLGAAFVLDEDENVTLEPELAASCLYSDASSSR